MEGHVNFTLSDRLRKSPYYESTLRAGAKTFTIYNHMIMPTSYEGSEADYWNLMNNVTMWDVAAERQVEITGTDAYRFVEYITSRDLSKLQIGQGKYALITDENAGIINDPIILRLGEGHFWLSIADSDVLLWTKGLACGLGWNVQICEPDVSPLAIQGPNHLPLMIDLFGEWVKDIKYFFFKEYELEGIPLIVQKSGWSKQGGFELYLRDGSQGNKLWDIVANAGKKYDIKPGTPNMYGLVGGEANAIQPGKRMLSSMTPSIVAKDGKLFMVVGTPGGSTIITSVFQTIINVIDYLNVTRVFL